MFLRQRPCNLPEKRRNMHRRKITTLLPFCLLILIFFVIQLGGFSMAAGTPAESGTSNAQQYLIGLGDIIEVQVWKEPDLTKKLVVRLDGRISLPLAGDVMAAGRSPEDLAKDIGKKLSAFIEEPAVSVTLEQSTSRRYYVIGQIAKPGEYTIDSPLSILQALARSGGFLEWAKKDKIIVSRRQNGRETILPFNYESLIEGKNLSQNIEIAPGDTIIVP